MDGLGVAQRLAGGHFLDELGIALVQVADEVVVTGNKGKVTVTLEISSAQEGEPTVIIATQIAKSPPKDKPVGALFWALEGQFHRQDPRQIPMEFRVVEDERGETRFADEDETAVREAE